MTNDVLYLVTLLAFYLDVFMFLYKKKYLLEHNMLPGYFKNLFFQIN